MALLVLFFQVWLFTGPIWHRPFPWKGRQWAFAVQGSAGPFTRHIPWRSALALWWGFVWRGTALMAISPWMFAVVDPVAILINACIWMFAFWWLLAKPMGHTRVYLQEDRPPR